jgi:Fic family protein
LNLQLPVSKEIVSELSALDRFQGRWSAQPPIPAERLRHMEQVAQVQSAAASGRLAGIRMTDAEVADILRGDAPPVGDAAELLGYAEAMCEQPTPGTLVNTDTLRGLHARMLGDADGETPWRRSQLHREAFDADGKATGHVFATLPPRFIEKKMDTLVTWLEFELRAREQHPVLVVGAFVIHLLAVSPFERANGRMARLLTNRLLHRAGYTAIPYASLEARVEELRGDYWEAISRSQTGLWSESPQLEPWLDFFLKALRRHRERLEAKIELERQVHDYPPLQQAILEAVREHGTVDAGLLLQATGANRNTLKDNLRKLVQQGVLDKLGERRGTRYRMSSGDIARTADQPLDH